METSFKEEYKEKLAPIEREYQARLEGKEQAIAIYHEQNINLTEIIKNQAANPGQPIEIYTHATAEAGSMKDNKSINIQARDITGSTISSGEISGTVTNTINQIPPSQYPDSAGLRELLTELHKLIEGADDRVMTGN